MIPISELMTKAVVVCSPEDSVTDVMKLITQQRIRHVSVKDGDQLVGIISIGDVLKHRLGELSWKQMSFGITQRLLATRAGLPNGRRKQGHFVS
jgi:signal-transduction protein with cAMP-binding, CBS, and nucleotidyltransferase domain